jgi:uncharacterized coiled-coil protein SlyX
MDDKKKVKNLDNMIPGHWVGGLGDEDDDGERLTPAERMKMVERVYQEVLLRKPDTRDLNYYKYSSLSEEEIRKELLNREEHKNLVENGREYQKTKNLLENSQSRIKVLERQILDQEESFKQFNVLLKEKNAHIDDLRSKLQNPFQDN